MKTVKIKATGIKTFRIQIRAVIKYDEHGRQIHGCIWGKWETWQPYSSALKSFKSATREANRRMLRTHIGYIVYRRTIINDVPTLDVERLFAAKWGMDKQPFTHYTPLGEQWRKGRIG